MEDDMVDKAGGSAGAVGEVGDVGGRPDSDVARRASAQSRKRAAVPAAAPTADAAEEADAAPVRKRRGRQPVPVRTQAFSEIAASWRRERPDLELENLLLMIALTRLARIVDTRYEAMCLERFGVTGPEVRLLFALRRLGHPFARRPTDLFRALIVTSGAITKQVDRLVAKKLVERTSDPLHAGGFLVHLTAKGLKVANMAAEDQAKNSLVADAMAQLNPEQRANGIEFIEHLLAGLEQGLRAEKSRSSR